MILEFTTSAHNTLTNQFVAKTRCAIRSTEVLFFHEAYDDDGKVDGTTVHMMNGDIMDLLESFEQVYKKIVEAELDGNF